MSIFRALLLAFLLSAGLASQPASAQDMNLQPKYGSLTKNDAQKAADAKFIASIDDYYKGDRKKGAEDVSSRGWQFLRQGNPFDAMKRFNQAWLLDNTNGNALWGMAAIQAGSGRIDEALKLFAEAEAFVGNDIDFSVDYAKVLGIAGAQTKNEALLDDAFARFARLYEQAPKHTLNLQNWAITLFYVGDYAEAWQTVKLAEATPRRAELDPRFLAALQSKMPRP
jgi:tetratricopeptide (TPR) repeat protein